MKKFKTLFLVLCVCISAGAYALSPEEANSKEYIYNHGHSPEMIRIMELQKARTEPESPENMEVKPTNRFVKFFRNIFYERDATTSVDNFGQESIMSSERPKR